MAMTIFAKAPCRVDIAGGTIDIWPLYLFHAGAVTVNFAIDRYASCRLTTRRDRKIVLRSCDLGGEEVFDSLEALRAAKRYRLPLVAYLVKFFAPETGIELTTDSEAPAGAGIAGSSTLIIAVSSALNRLTGAGHTIEKLREISQNIEAQIIRVPTGAQDYYPAMYGGANAIELGEAGIARQPLAVDLDDLDERIVLAYTGVPRNSGINNWEVMKAHIDGDRAVYRNFDRIAAIATAMRRALEQADWNEAARLLRAEWTNRKKNAPGISTPLIDKLVAVTRRAGAVGAKACGAGGGGCVFFLVRRGAKERVAEAIAREGATVLPVRVAPEGVRVRTAAD
jgi:D-glycero-alpha-D-manno-heptose-7-phosphate kinase